MTRSEKKASKAIADEALNIAGAAVECLGDADSWATSVEKIADYLAPALSEAERRGFERAKREALELCKIKHLTGTRLIGTKDLENLKYEEA